MDWESWVLSFGFWVLSFEKNHLPLLASQMPTQYGIWGVAYSVVHSKRKTQNAKLKTALRFPMELSSRVFAAGCARCASQ
jgi:hypothetical protein